MKIVADGGEFYIPAAFWKSLSKAEVAKVFRTSKLNAAQCARIWRMTDRQGAPPQEVEVAVKKADIDRWLETLPKDAAGRPVLPNNPAK